MRCAKHIISCAVAVVAAGIGVFAFQRSGSRLQVHFIAALAAIKQSRKQVNFLVLDRAVLRGDPFLREVKSLLVDQRLMRVRKEIPFIFGILPRLFGLIRDFIGLGGDGMA